LGDLLLSSLAFYVTRLAVAMWVVAVAMIFYGAVYTYSEWLHAKWYLLFFDPTDQLYQSARAHLLTQALMALLWAWTQQRPADWLKFKTPPLYHQ